MKIAMRSIGMALFTIQKVKERGVDTSNLLVNMDWQHLIMNGENLAEYARLLAMEGKLGHQHGNSGWGDFDDDNMVGALRFMETLELDPAVWWEATADALARLLRNSDIDPNLIEGIGLSGQMHGSVLLVENKRVLRPAILWCDQRTVEECDWIERIIGPEKWNRWVANRPLNGFTAPKILWVKRHEPHIYSQIRHVLLPKDYIRLRLTAHSDQPFVDPENRLHAFCHAVAGKWHTMGVILSAAECLKWWRTNVGQQAEQIAKHSGRSVYDVLCEAAGGAKSPVWRQIIADVTGIEVVVLAADEGPAYGAALLAGVGAGWFASIEDACERLIAIRDRIAPDPERHERYNDYYEVYRQMYGVLQGQFHRLSELERKGIH